MNFLDGSLSSNII